MKKVKLVTVPTTTTLKNTSTEPTVKPTIATVTTQDTISPTVLTENSTSRHNRQKENHHELPTCCGALYKS